MNWKLIWEAGKEPLREIVLAAIPGILAYLQTVSAEWAVVLYLLLRGFDQYLHEVWKENKKGELVRGIVPF